MLINCPHCSARVDAKQHDLLDRLNREEDGYASSGIRVRLLQCPSCNNPLVSKEELKSHTLGDFNEDEIEWSPPQRVWPEPETTFGTAIPRGVRVSLDEARGSLSSGYYTASVVMSGRALEAIARHFHVPSSDRDRMMLGRGLQQLHSTGKIDDRLFEWGKELQEHRNLAAHPTDHVFEQEDAQDLFEFVNAICEYLFVLQDRYDRFIKRKESRSKATEGAAGAE
jgi:hypothetical protein